MSYASKIEELIADRDRLAAEVAMWVKFAEAEDEGYSNLLADHARLAAELEEANKDEQAAYELTARLTAEVEAAANLLELAHVYMKDDGNPAFKTIEGRVKEFINRVDRSAAIAATPEVKP